MILYFTLSARAYSVLETYVYFRLIMYHMYVNNNIMHDVYKICAYVFILH